jgi:hypothetical protein
MGVLFPFPTGRDAILDESGIGRRPQPRRHSAAPPGGCRRGLIQTPFGGQRAAAFLRV